MPDLQKELESLFTEMTRVMREKLKAEDVDAATLGQIRQFLKDNGIESRPEAGNRGLLRLAQEFPEFPEDEVKAA